MLILAAMLPLRLQAAASELSVSPGSLPYGKVAVGKTRTLHVTVTNHGKSSVRISGIHSSNGDFTVAKTTLPKTLTAGAKLTLSVTFSPAAAGWVGGHVTVVSNAANHSLNLTVAGIVAHQSALKDGELLKIPQYQRPTT